MTSKHLSTAAALLASFALTAGACIADAPPDETSDDSSDGTDGNGLPDSIDLPEAGPKDKCVKYPGHCACVKEYVTECCQSYWGYCTQYCQRETGNCTIQDCQPGWDICVGEIVPIEI